MWEQRVFGNKTGTLGVRVFSTHTIGVGWGVPMCRMVTWESNFDVGCDEVKYRLSVLRVRAAL